MPYIWSISKKKKKKKGEKSGERDQKSGERIEIEIVESRF